MCGIVGTAYGPAARAAHRPRRADALGALRHRGPDMQGDWADDAVWLGHTRLSILDLSAAACQPMIGTEGRYVISYNGEVYNYAELAASLGLGDLRTTSDTEVVLRAFALRGTASLRLLNGIFALAIYDRETRKLVLARDRLGVKPLYYRLDDGQLSFASEVKSLLAANGEHPACDRSALHEWLYFGTSLGERTLYTGIRQLLPGHVLELDVDTFESRVSPYWAAAEFAGGPKDEAPLEKKSERIRQLLDDAVARQLVSDVPVGVFLSGGIDSSAITAFAARHYRGKLASYSVGFDFAVGENELPKARRLAAHFGTDHHELFVAGVDIADVVRAMVDHHGLPFSDAANIPLYLLASRIKDSTKVVLQGDGGDELFGGYSRYTTLSHFRTARAAARVGGLVNAFTPRNAAHFRRRRYARALSGTTPSDVMALLLTEENVEMQPERVFSDAYRRDVIASDAFARFRECQAMFDREDLVNQMLFVDLMIVLPDVFLEKVDRSTMAASVEARVPFLDNDLVEYCLRLTGSDKVRGGVKKWLLKQALAGVVPDDILHGPKFGFGVPYGEWLRGALRPLLFDELATFATRFPGVLDVDAIAAMHRAHVERRHDRSFLLWKVLNFAIWANTQPAEFAL